MEGLRKRWKRIPQAVRKPLVFIVGSAVVATGILMLVFPGPGWAAIFIGFAILATEFAFAERVRDWMKTEVILIGKKIKEWWRAIRNKK